MRRTGGTPAKRAALSNSTLDARAFPETPPGARRSRELARPRTIALAGIGIILGAALINAALRGPWLDEFWTLELSDSRHGLLSLIRDGWLRDAHPPLFNAWATLLAALGVESIPAGRLVSNVLAAGSMLLAAHRLVRRMPGQAGFTVALLLLVLSLPPAIEAFATYRSYFWQIAALTILVLVARHVASAKADLDLRREADLAAIAAVATMASIGLHYVGGLFGGLLAGAIALSAHRRGLHRWTYLLLATMALAGGLLLTTALLQMPNWVAEFDHSWIDLPGLQALGVPASLALVAIAHNPLAFAGLRLGPHGPDAAEWRFLAMVGGALVAGVALILAGHSLKPIVVERYLWAVPVLVSALMAVPAARLVRTPRLFGLLALVSAAVAVGPLVESGIKPLWNEDSDTIATIVANCPTTRIYAASGWALGPAAETRTARREDPVFERAYRLLAERHGYTVRYIGQNGTAHATPGPCPVLLWYEHTPNEAEDDLPAAIGGSGLTGLEEARLSVIRSDTGFVIRADQQ